MPIAVLILLIGIAILAYAIWCAIVSIRNRSWPEVEAVIVSANVEEEYNEGIYYKAKITYRYSVNGFDFIGSRIKIAEDMTYSSPRRPQRIVAKYPKGTTLRAKYSPTDPSLSVLESGPNFSIVMLFLVAHIIIVMAWNWLTGAVILE